MRGCERVKECLREREREREKKEKKLVPRTSDGEFPAFSFSSPGF